MFKVISNKRYDTERAEKLASWSNGSGKSNFNHCEETLYRKRTGEYFLHGEGHARSRYAAYDASGLSGWGEKIVPMSEEAARSWAEERLSGKEYEAIFGPPDEDAEAIISGFSAPAADVEKLKKLALNAGIPVAEYLRRMIHQLQ